MHIKPLQCSGEAAEFKFEPNFEPLLVIWQLESLPKAIPGDNQSFDCKINGQALGTALLHSFGWLETVGLASRNTRCFQVSCSVGSDLLS